MLRIPKWLNLPKYYLLNIQSRFDLYTTSFVCVLVSVFSFQIDCMNFMYVACWKWTLYKIKMKLNQMLGWNLLIMLKNWLCLCSIQCVVVPVHMINGFSNLIRSAKIDECLQAQKQHKRLWQWQNKTLFLTMTLNKMRIDLDVENTDNTADTNKITWKFDQRYKRRRSWPNVWGYWWW